MALAEIGTLWIGGSLSWLEILCLKSFVAEGHDVTLFTYDTVENVPDGVRIEPAASILPSERIIRHAKTGSPAYHADVFRLHLMQQTDMVWADTDAYCVRPWVVPDHGHFHGWISDDKPVVNNGVLRLPKDSKTLAAMLAFTADEYPVPPWFSDAARQDLEDRKAKGDGVHVSLLPWGVWGPNALTWFLRQTGEIEYAQPGHVIYPIPFKMAGAPMNPNRAGKVARMIARDTLSIHFWGRRFRNVAARTAGLPPADSYVAELLAKHGIAPAETSHLMQPAAPEPANVEEDIDFSPLAVTDVANLVLQRSEVIDSGPAVRAWEAGDDAPLHALAEAHRETILKGCWDAARSELAKFSDPADGISPARVADIGCGYGFVDLMLYRRFGCDLVLIDIETSEDRHFGFAEEGSGYSSLTTARAFLEANGVPADKIQTLDPRNDPVDEVAPVDMAISLISCGFHYPAATYETFFENQVSVGGGIVLDIRKGSRGLPYMKRFGALTVLQKSDKHSMIFVNRGAAGD